MTSKIISSDNDCTTNLFYFSHRHVPKSTQKFDARTDRRERTDGQRLRERSSSRPECKIVSHPETDNLRAQKRHRTSEFQAAARGNAEAWTAVLLCGRRKIVNYAFLPFSVVRTQNRAELHIIANEDRCAVNRARNKGLYMVARNLFLLLLNCSAWTCLAVA